MKGGNIRQMFLSSCKAMKISLQFDDFFDKIFQNIFDIFILTTYLKVAKGNAKKKKNRENLF